MLASGSTVDDAELARFADQADAWWDPEGSFHALHRLNPTRLAFIRSRLLRHFKRDSNDLRPFAGLRLLDVGCGGGLVAEPMARLGFSVTGIDAEPEAIATARSHAQAAGLAIDYQLATAESVADSGEGFDAVLALEIAEHVADREALWSALGRLAAPGAAVIAATLNRTPRSFALAIVGAEYIFRWLPRGTHDWRRFLRPSELVLGLRRHHLRTTEIAGVSYDPMHGGWALSRDLKVNYMVMAVRQ